MSVAMEGVYAGRKRTRLVHLPSGAELVTDAPRDNAGEGASFSPTDLVAAALGSCTMTVMGIAAERSGIDLAGMRMRVEKEMKSDPRRIGKLGLVLHLPERLTPEDRQKMENTARTCPVARSLHPDVELDVCFFYDV